MVINGVKKGTVKIHAALWSLGFEKVLDKGSLLKSVEKFPVVVTVKNVVNVIAPTFCNGRDKKKSE